MLTEPSDLIDAISGVWSSTIEATASLAPSDWTTPTDCPGWSVQDHVAHVATGQLILLQRLEPERELPDLPHVRHDFGRWFEQYVDVRRALAGAAVRDEYAALAEEAGALLRSLDDAGLDAEIEGPAGATFSRRRFLPIITFDHWVHEQDIRRALGRPGPLDTTAAGHGRDSMLNGLGRKWSASADAGTIVAVDVTGEGGRAVTITLGETPTVDDDIDAGAAATITAPLPAFTALATGRQTAGQIGADLQVEGDDALVATLLEHASVTP